MRYLACPELWPTTRQGGRQGPWQARRVNLRTLPLVVALALCAGCAVAPTNLDEISKSSTELQEVPIEALNPDVRQETIQQTICVPGYAASVRPPTSYTNGVKAKLLREAGRLPTAAPDYELDHRVPLALGGHPRNLKNLELQPWEGEDGAKKKDRLERKLQSLVCAEKVALRDAQRTMYYDWKQALRENAQTR